MVCPLMCLSDCEKDVQFMRGLIVACLDGKFAERRPAVECEYVTRL